MAREQEPTTAIDGFVERLDEDTGVEGWAVDRHMPDRPLMLELWAGDTMLATTHADLDRPDVCAALNLKATPGFRFDANIRDVIRAAAADGLAEELTVRVAGEARPAPLPGVSRNLELVRLDLAGKAPATSDTLFSLLAIHERSAKRRLASPLPPLPKEKTGMLEALAVDEAGLIWITGWIVEDRILDRPAMILDDGRHSAGMVCTVFRRDDLPPGAIGFVGVLQSDWRPTSSTPPHLLMADSGASLLTPLLPTPVTSWSASAPLISHYLSRAEGLYRDVLRDLFHVTPQWEVPAGRTAPDMLQIDEITILPGFGAFVGGWSLSPTKTVEKLTLKTGKQIVGADPRSITHIERPDLATVYPHHADAVRMAGFVALFPGAFAHARIDDMVVKATWSDGSSTNDRVLPHTTRILGRTAQLEATRRFYPEIEAEHFFPDFAAQAARNAQSLAREVRAHAVDPADAILILVAPTNRSDLFLMIDNAQRHAALLPPTWGIVVLAEGGPLRPTLVSLFADLKRATGRRCSLFFTPAGHPTTDAVEAVAQALDATRFAFVAPGISLNRAGWAAIGQPHDGLTLLSVVDPIRPDETLHNGLDAFVADRATWQTLIASGVPRVGGIALPDEGPSAHPSRRVISDAAISLGRKMPSPLIARINQATEHHHA